MHLIICPFIGHRSVYRDLEAQFAIVTQNSNLQNQLHRVSVLAVQQESRRAYGTTVSKVVINLN